MDNAVVKHFVFASPLLGFHIYKNTKNWRPVKTQEQSFHREFDNDFDRFAVAGKTVLPDKLAPFIVGHVPHKLS